MSEAKRIFDLFMKTKYKSIYGTRGNCGPAAIDLMLFFESNGIDADRVRGSFKCDIPVHDKKDFTIEMREEFNKDGLDFNSKEDRFNWINNSSYRNEWLNCPHYWVEAQNQIFDPSGYAQFVESGLSSDIDTNRYYKESID